VFVNYQQDNWTLWLPITEFASNNHALETTEYSQFFDNYWFHPRMTFRQHPIQNGNDIREFNTNTLSQKINDIFEQMKTELARAQWIKAEQADTYC
jgi:hypothetical protein